MRDDKLMALTNGPGADLQYLIDQLGGEIESVLELTRLVSAHQRKASFKLTLRDGRSFKARRFMTADSFSSALSLAPHPVTRTKGGDVAPYLAHDPDTLVSENASFRGNGEGNGTADAPRIRICLEDAEIAAGWHAARVTIAL